MSNQKTEKITIYQFNIPYGKYKKEKHRNQWIWWQRKDIDMQQVQMQNLSIVSE